MSTEGLVYDRIAWTWVTPEEMARRDAHREELAFQRQLSQGQLAAPAVIRDGQGGIHGVKSMANGKLYDSKSAMRRHYREAGVVEVGNDSSVTPEGIRSYVSPHARKKTTAEREQYQQRLKHDVEKAISDMNMTRRYDDEVR